MVLMTIVSRIVNKKYDVAIGPEPMINNLYHKKALEIYGYKVKTFVCFTYYITKDFDKNFQKFRNLFSARYYIAFLYVIFNFKILYIYFNGGPLSWTPLRRFEALLYKIAKVKTVVMPYGGDVQVLDRCNNLIYKNAVVKDYPNFQKSSRKKILNQIDYWTKHAGHIISGCDWVDYMYSWNTLMPAHFSLDINSFKGIVAQPKTKSFRVLHAPNHKEIKGTAFLEKAIVELKNEGYDFELLLIQKMPNETLKSYIASADLVVDQLVIGWHGIFALEAMALAKPVVCYIREDLKKLFLADGCLKSEDDLPFINADIFTIKESLKDAYANNDILGKHARKSIQYLNKYHSLESVGNKFDSINRGLVRFED